MRAPELLRGVVESFRPVLRGAVAVAAVGGLAVTSCAGDTPSEQAEQVGEVAQVAGTTSVLDAGAEGGRATGQGVGSTSVTAPEAELATTAGAVDAERSPGDVARDEYRSGAEMLVAGDFAQLPGPRIGVVLNAASTVHGEPLLDVLARSDRIELVSAFAPEHGVRSDLPAGARVADGSDAATGVAVHSLYGETRRPTTDQLAGLDALVFDLQDVGTRPYTYIATMGYAMQAAAEASIPFVVLDRPNPLGGRLVEGPTLTDEQASFVGLYPVPLVHGLTTGELAAAIVGEGWLSGLGDLDLRVVELHGWHRDTAWNDLRRPWIPTSPSLPTVASVTTYPGTVLFEATSLSLGRGTEQPFQVVGAPWVDADRLAAALGDARLPGVRFEATTFVPRPSVSVPDPPHDGLTVSGVRLVVTDTSFRPVVTAVHLLVALRDLAAETGEPSIVSSPELLDRLAGTSALRIGLEEGRTADEIVDAWRADAEAFERVRQAYLRYD